MVAKAEAMEAAGGLQDEMEELRRGLLPAFLTLMPLGLLAWTCIRLYALDVEQVTPLPLLLSLGFAALIWHIGRRHWHLAAWLTLFGMVWALWLLCWTRALSLAPAFGVILVIAANALLGSREAFLAAGLAWGAGVLAQHLGLGSSGSSHLQSLLLHLAAWLAIWLAGLPVSQSMAMTFEGWVKARNALNEVRLRRAELYRALRALEEATARLERSNNELIIAQQEAEMAHAFKAHLAATVSHELRGPLNFVLGFSELILLSPESYDEPLPRCYLEDVSSIYRNSRHLLELIDDVLDLSRIEAKRLPMLRDHTDIDRDVIDPVVQQVQLLAERKGLYLHYEPPGNLPWIMADRTRLRQVVLNLLTNAIRVTETGGITVQVLRLESEIQVTVQDTGPGIPEELVPVLFREFQQMTNQTSDKRGSGLGLAISKHLVELHGGRMWVGNETRKGSSFHFALPIAGCGPEAGEIVHTRQASGRRKDVGTCLVVHEDPRIVSLLARYIEDYHLVGVPLTDRVPEMVEELHPQAILVHPEQACQLVSLLATIPHDVPVISCRMPRLGQVEPFSGILRYLVKPITSELLAEAMSQLQPEEEVTVLVVDDEREAVALIERMLTALPRPYRILRAYDGLQAWELMAKTVPHVVFLDLVMPRMDGQQLLQRMRAEERTRNIPVVVTSAQDWLDGAADLGVSLSIRCGQPLDIATGAQCIKALLEHIKPNYLQPGMLGRL